MSTEPISIAELSREADERLTASRLGKSIARETDRDLLTIRHLRNALMVAATRQPDRAVEVRALPDREMIARVIDPGAWEPPLLPETYREVRRNMALELADSVLALFEQEGQ